MYSLSEYNQTAHLKAVKEESFEDGKEQGIAIGKEQGIVIGKEQGIAIGEERGVQNVNKLYDRLIELGRIDDMKKAVKDSNYRSQLMRELFSNKPSE